MNNVLVVAVHPDDETLGAGGTLLKHKSNGDKIYWLIGTDIKKEDQFSEESVLKREKEIKKVQAMYPFDGLFRLGLSTMKTDQYSNGDIIKRVSQVINEIKPNIIYLPFMNDVHSDHRIIFEAAYSCTKSFRYPSIKKIYMMETLSETEFAPAISGETFTPNVFVDITQFYQSKIEIMRVYHSELGEHPFPRSERNLEALATYRGAAAGVTYAEAFMLLKEIS